MKKILFIIIAALCMVGCNNNKTQDEPTPATGKVTLNNLDNVRYHVSIYRYQNAVVDSYINGKGSSTYELEPGYHVLTFTATGGSMLFGTGSFTIEKGKTIYFNMKGK